MTFEKVRVVFYREDAREEEYVLYLSQVSSREYLEDSVGERVTRSPSAKYHYPPPIKPGSDTYCCTQTSQSSRSC